MMSIILLEIKVFPVWVVMLLFSVVYQCRIYLRTLSLSCRKLWFYHGNDKNILSLEAFGWMSQHEFKLSPVSK